MRIELHGTNTAKFRDENDEWHEITTPNKRGPIGPLCRLLIAAGYDPSQHCEVYRNGTLVFHAATLLHYADYDVGESDSNGLSRRKYVPFDRYSAP